MTHVAQQRTLILSDLHLGRSRGVARSPAALRPVWNEVDRLVLNGDTADLSHPGIGPRARRAFDELTRLCADDGVEMVVLSGNHDPAISERGAIELADGQVFITHGDAFHPSVTPWGPIAPLLRAHRANVLENLGAGRGAQPGFDLLEAELQAAREASHLEWERLRAQGGGARYRSILTRPRGLLSVPIHWRQFPRLAAAFADRHDLAARFIVFGHTHRSGIWRIRGRTLINTGSFGFPGRPRGVLIDNGMLRVFDVRRTRGGLRLTPRPRARFELDQPGSGDDEAQPSAAKTRDAGDRPIRVAT